MQLAYEAPMLVDLDQVAADCDWGGICVTGGGALDKVKELIHAGG